MEYRCTKQYQAIYDFVMNHRTHPTAEDVYQEIVQIIPNISLKTVNRNLYKLVEEGKITRISMANEKDRFDGQTMNHYHLCCNQCHNFVDIDLPYQDQLNEMAAKKSHYQISAHTIIFKGICPQCLNQIKEKKEKWQK